MSPLPLLSSWRAVYFYVESGEWPRQSVSTEVSGGESPIICTSGVPTVACLVLRLGSAGCTFHEHMFAACFVPAQCWAANPERDVGTVPAGESLIELNPASGQADSVFPLAGAPQPVHLDIFLPGQTRWLSVQGTHPLTAHLL